MVAGVYVMSTYGCHTCHPEYIEAVKKRKSSRNLRKATSEGAVVPEDDI